MMATRQGQRMQQQLNLARVMGQPFPSSFPLADVMEVQGNVWQTLILVYFTEWLAQLPLCTFHPHRGGTTTSFTPCLCFALGSVGVVRVQVSCAALELQIRLP